MGRFNCRRRGNLIVAQQGQSGLCPECQCRGELVPSTPAIREWRDVSILDTRIVFRYPPREIRCPTHGRRQEWIPIAAPRSQVTHRLDYLVAYHCKAMTQKAAAERLHLAPSTLSDLLHRVIERTWEGHRIRGLRKIGIDEISYRKGHQYATIVYDLEKRRVLCVGKGWGRKTIDWFFKEELSEAQRLSITEASCDMSGTFIGAIKEHCPNATLTLDRFHLDKAMRDAVDKVRKEPPFSRGCAGYCDGMRTPAPRGSRARSTSCGLSTGTFGGRGFSRTNLMRSSTMRIRAAP